MRNERYHLDLWGWKGQGFSSNEFERGKVVALIPDETSSATIKVGGDEVCISPDMNSRWGGDGRAVGNDQSGGLSQVYKRLEETSTSSIC